MTRNQVEYRSVLEQERSNKIKEAETRRSNIANETETKRSNITRETETNRANLAKEAETNRTNVANENLRLSEFKETKRNNVTRNILEAVKVPAEYLGSISKLIPTRR